MKKQHENPLREFKLHIEINILREKNEQLEEKIKRFENYLSVKNTENEQLERSIKILNKMVDEDKGDFWNQTQQTILEIRHFRNIVKNLKYARGMKNLDEQMKNLVEVLEGSIFNEE